MDVPDVSMSAKTLPSTDRPEGVAMESIMNRAENVPATGESENEVWQSTDMYW